MTRRLLLLVAATAFAGSLLFAPFSGGSVAEAHCFNVTGKHNQLLHSGNTSLHAHQALLQHAPAVITENPCS
jgi:hypothetical protein